MLRDQRDAAHDYGFGFGSGGLEVDAGDNSADHLSHLGLRQCRSDAASDTTPERQPGVRLGLFVDEPFGAELIWLRVETSRRWTAAIAGYRRIPAGRSQPPIVRGLVRVRSAASITGRRRSDSVTTASRKVSSSPLAAVTQPSKHWGLRGASRMRRPGQWQWSRGRQEHRHQLVTQFDRSSADRPRGARNKSERTSVRCSRSDSERRRSISS